jgi:tetratricopeptide (TPR) repeat protein
VTKNRINENYNAETYLVLANALIPHDCDGAERVLRDGMQQFPRASGFHLLLARLQQSRGRYFDAFLECQWELLRTGGDRAEGRDAAIFCAELMKDPNASAELSELLQAVHEMHRNPRRARKLFDRIIRRKGDELLLLLYKAEAAQNSGDSKIARDIYRRIIELDPAFVPAFVQLSELLQQAGHQYQAEQLLSRAREIEGQPRCSPGLVATKYPQVGDGIDFIHMAPQDRLELSEYIAECEREAQ